MKYAQLVWAGLFRRKTRMILTLLSVMVAFVLFGLLDTVRGTFEGFGQSSAGHDRLVTTEKRYRPLPLSLHPRIMEVPGVIDIDPGYAFSGTYQDPKNVVQAETHTESFPALYPEWKVRPEHWSAFLRTRTGVLAGETLMSKYKWKVGDKIPLQTKLARKDGSTTWTFDLVGTYSFKDVGMKVWENILYVNWDYLDKARAKDEGTVTWYSIKVAGVSEVDRVSRAIDDLSANSGHETKTQSENAFSAEIISQFGDMGLLVTSVMGAVFFTLLLLTGHTITQAVHERIPEVAVLKTIGFTGKRIMALILSESVLLLLLGAAAGLALASLTLSAVRSMVGIVLPISMPIPIMPVGGDVWLRGLLIAALIGLIVGALPALRGLRLRIVDALSGH